MLDVFPRPRDLHGRRGVEDQRLAVNGLIGPFRDRHRRRNRRDARRPREMRANGIVERGGFGATIDRDRRDKSGQFTAHHIGGLVNIRRQGGQHV